MLNNDAEDKELNATTIQTDSDPENFPGITGWAIGNLGEASSFGLIIGIIIVLVGLYFVFLKRGSKNKQPHKK